MKSKKAVIEQMMGFVLAFLILVFLWIFLKVVFAVPGFGKAELGFTATAKDMPGSPTCDYVLLNFLRSGSDTELSPAEMLSTSILDFKAYADEWFALNYTRGNPRLRGWQIVVSSKNTDVPLLTTGKITTLNSKFSCAQLVPTFKDDYLVRLWLDY